MNANDELYIKYMMKFPSSVFREKCIKYMDLFINDRKKFIEKIGEDEWESFKKEVITKDLSLKIDRILYPMDLNHRPQIGQMLAMKMVDKGKAEHSMMVNNTDFDLKIILERRE